MDPNQTVNQNIFNDGQFFGDTQYNASGMPSSGMTPYLGGTTNDGNVFENEYSMQGQFDNNNNNNHYMNSFDMGMNGISSIGEMDGMSFDPSMMMAHKPRENSSTSSTGNSGSSASPQGKHSRPRALPMSSSNSSVAVNSPTNNGGGGGGGGGQDGAMNTAKRNRFLERNRLAAAKCRTKKKEWTNNLEAAARQASQQTRELHAIVQNLRNEVQEHKAMLMCHQGCDCVSIHDYLHHSQQGHERP